MSRLCDDHAAARQMEQLLIDLFAGLEPWRMLTLQCPPEGGDKWSAALADLPRSTDRSREAFAARMRILRAVVERAERLLP